MYSSIDELIDQATKIFDQAPAFSLKVGFRTETYTYREIGDYIKRLPVYLSDLGIQKGDRILIVSLNRPEYAVTILGGFYSNVVLIPVDYRTNVETLTKFIDATHPKAIFTTALFAEPLSKLGIKVILFEELFEKLAQCNVIDREPPAKDELAAILFTSGTTGEPKGTMITHGNILAGLNYVREVFRLPKDLKILSVLPLSHALEVVGGLLTAYSYGSQIYYLERVNGLTILQALRRYRINAMAVVPQMLRIVMLDIERKVELDNRQQQWQRAHNFAPYLPTWARKDLFKEVHNSLGGKFSFFVCGSAPLDQKLAKMWSDMGVTILEGYGASETTGIIATNTLADNKYGTVGKILPDIQWRLSDTGELLVKGQNIVSGYYNNPEKTQESFTDGWFHTGDIVRLTKDKRLQIIGRDKFKIVLPDGKKVYPEDIENKLDSHPFVIDSTVFGLDLGQGEVVHAEVIAKPGVSLPTVITEVNKKLNPHEQILDYAIWPENDFPRTKTLKVDRQKVKDVVLARKAQAPGSEVQNDQVQDDKLITILRTVFGFDTVPISEQTVLSTDLKFDSLKRIELLALIEEELSVSIEELKITPQTTVADLRLLVKDGKPVVPDDGIRIPNWQFTNRADVIRVALQDGLIFPIFHTKFKVKIVHPENLKKIIMPQLFIFNHVGVYDVTNLLTILPRDIRKRTAVAATHVMWEESKVRGFLGSAVGNLFPFVKAESGDKMRGNFERIGQILDYGYNIIISPEGNITHTGELLPFHTGAGYIAVEMHVPVTPFKINGYYELWPEDDTNKHNLYWPNKGGTVEVVVGEPINFDSKTTYEEATAILRQSIIDLK